MCYIIFVAKHSGETFVQKITDFSTLKKLGRTLFKNFSFLRGVLESGCNVWNYWDYLLFRSKKKLRES